MTLQRLRAGEAVAGVGALALLLLLFLDWAKPETRVRTAPGVRLSSPLQETADRVVGRFVDQFAQSGWSALGWVLVLMLLVAIAGGLALVALTVLERDTPVLPVVTAVSITSWSGLTALVLLVRLTLAQPGLVYGWEDRDVDILAPAWLGLLALLLIAAGGWLTLRDDRLDSPFSAEPDAPLRPTPPAVA